MRYFTVYIYILPCYFPLHWSRYSPLRFVLKPHQLINQSSYLSIYLWNYLLSINYISINLTENWGDRSKFGNRIHALSLKTTSPIRMAKRVHVKRHQCLRIRQRV